jgi:NTE family protein
MPRYKPPVAVALGSGALHGFAHIGVIKAFEAQGFRPDIVTGTSAGAVAGALWAYGLSAARIQAAVADLGWWAGRSVSLRTGVFANDAVGELIAQHTKGMPMQHWRTRFAAVATDFATGERVAIAEGPAGPAVQASTSLPAIYSPVALRGRSLVDGALTEPVPVRVARELGARVVIAVDIAYRPWEAPVRNLLDAPFQMMHVMVNQLIAEQIQGADIAIRLAVHHFFEEADVRGRLVTAGEQSVEENWPRIASLTGN